MLFEAKLLPGGRRALNSLTLAAPPVGDMIDLAASLGSVKLEDNEDDPVLIDSFRVGDKSSLPCDGAVSIAKLGRFEPPPPPSQAFDNKPDLTLALRAISSAFSASATLSAAVKSKLSAGMISLLRIPHKMIVVHDVQ